LCSVCAPFIIYALLSYWKCIANCHIECSVRRSAAAIPDDPGYQVLTRRCFAHDCQLWSERRDEPRGFQLVTRPRRAATIWCWGTNTAFLTMALTAQIAS